MIQARDIETLFQKQLDGIEDASLREKTVETWVKGCALGGWKSVEELHQIPFTLLTDTCGVSFVDHTIAVTDGAVALGRAQTEGYKKLPYKINFDRLSAGGLLHDVGKLMEIEPDGKGGYRKSLAGKYARHPISGAIIASECGITDDVLNMIICHAKEGDGRPQVLEAVLVHQADFATFNPLVMKQKGTLIED
ncbi:HD domain-containing protein [bacterium]|nr:HD domain-containing protein [bacterium]